MLFYLVFDLIENSCRNEKGETEGSFIDFSLVLKKVKEETKLKDLSKHEMKKLLIDLNKMGFIIYINNSLMNKTIISNPEWLNNVFISLIDFGRRKVEEKIEEIHHFFRELQDYKFHKQKDNCREFCSKTLYELKSRAKQGLHYLLFFNLLFFWFNILFILYLFIYSILYLLIYLI